MDSVLYSVISRYSPCMTVYVCSPDMKKTYMAAIYMIHGQLLKPCDKFSYSVQCKYWLAFAILNGLKIVTDTNRMQIYEYDSMP